MTQYFGKEHTQQATDGGKMNLPELQPDMNAGANIEVIIVKTQARGIYRFLCYASIILSTYLRNHGTRKIPKI